MRRLVIVVVGVLILGYMAYQQIVEAPIAERRLLTLQAEADTIAPPPGASLVECSSTSGPGRALVVCKYLLKQDARTVAAHYERVLVGLAWRRCGGQSEAGGGTYWRYCKGDEHALVEYGYTKEWDFSVSLNWGL